MKSKVKGVRLKGYLLEWAENLDNGDFSYHVKEALRQYLSDNGSVKHIFNTPTINAETDLVFKEKKDNTSVEELESKLDNF